MHHQRLARLGDPLAKVRKIYYGLSAWEAFWNRVIITNDPCWGWDGAHSSAGYARFFYGEVGYQAGRWLWEQLYGYVPKTYDMDHLCRNRACINPDHLEPVPHQENLARGIVGSRNKIKTHCKRGHPFDKVNTYIDREGYRQCVTCLKMHRKNYQLRKLAAQSR